MIELTRFFERPILGPTTMDNELAFIMANQVCLIQDHWSRSFASTLFVPCVQEISSASNSVPNRPKSNQEWLCWIHFVEVVAYWSQQDILGDKSTGLNIILFLVLNATSKLFLLTSRSVWFLWHLPILFIFTFSATCIGSDIDARVLKGMCDMQWNLFSISFSPFANKERSENIV